MEPVAMDCPVVIVSELGPLRAELCLRSALTCLRALGAPDADVRLLVPEAGVDARWAPCFEALVLEYPAVTLHPGDVLATLSHWALDDAGLSLLSDQVVVAGGKPWPRGDDGEVTALHTDGACRAVRVPGPQLRECLATVQRTPALFDALGARVTRRVDTAVLLGQSTFIGDASPLSPEAQLACFMYGARLTRAANTGALGLSPLPDAEPLAPARLLA